MSKAEELREALGIFEPDGYYGASKDIAAAICDTLGITREMVGHELVCSGSCRGCCADALTALLEVAGR